MPRVDLDDLVVRTRTLGQSYPFSSRAYRYVNRVVARERTSQPVPELGIWAGYALTNGYCLRRVEEIDSGRTVDVAPAGLPMSLDDAATHVAALVRTEGAEPYLLFDEERVVAALDRLIGGEIERRLSHWEGTIDDDSWAQVEDYLAWWTIKGYALAVVERLVPEDGDDET